MAKLSTKQVSTTKRVIIYGGPKTGKSLLAGKLAEYYNLFWFDLESGHDVLFKLPPAWQERVEVIDIPDTRSFPVAIETCLKVVKSSKPVVICEEHGKVSCAICTRSSAATTTIDLNSLTTKDVLVFDSLTQLTNSAIAHITKGQPDDYKLDYNDWGNLGKLLDIFLSHIQQAKYHVVVISHEQEVETEGKKNVLMPVGGTRNFSRNVAKYFTDVVYAERKNKKHVFASSTSYSSTILTGSRTDAILEDTSKGEASLLQVFQPELYKDSQNSPASKPSTSPAKQGGGTSASSILDRIKKK